MPRIAPSILAADFAKLEQQCAEAIDAGANILHIDVMDGHFVPNITIGPLIVRALRPLADRTNTTLDVHLMIENPDQYVEIFAEAGSDIITVHQEACVHLDRVIQQVKQTDKKVGVALNPATPIETLSEVASKIDLVCIMSVNPGFGGQSYITGTSSKISRLKRFLTEHDSNALIEVDGGVKTHNIREVADAGADILVAGSAVFRGGDIAGNVTGLLDQLG